MSAIAEALEAPPAPAVSEARKVAARLNGSRSRGSVTDAGKAISRRNAVKHGLAGVLAAQGETAEVERQGLRHRRGVPEPGDADLHRLVDNPG